MCPFFFIVLSNFKFDGKHEILNGISNVIRVKILFGGILIA